MNKEPLGLYIFRLFLWMGLAAFMAMLYWSSTLVEQDLKFLRLDATDLKNQVSTMQSDLNKIRTDLNKISLFQPLSSSSAVSSSVDAHSSSNSSEVAQANDANLLQIDPFYLSTLPNLLGPHFTPSGIRQEATVGRPHNLHPFSNWSQVASWNALCTVGTTSQLFGKYETFAPDMATKMELRYNQDGRPEYWLFLRRDVFWQPLNPASFSEDIGLAPHFLKPHQVTAHDFKFYIDAILNPHVQEAQAVALRVYFSDIQEMEIIDDFTLVVRWKTEELPNEQGQLVPKMKYMTKAWTGSLRPLASFVYKYFADGTKIVSNDEDPNTYRTNPIWAQNFSRHWAQNIIVSCGAWTFNGMTDREIRFKRNEDFYEPYAVLVNGLEVKFKDSPDNIWEDFKSGNLDLFQVPPNQLAELDRFLESKPYQAQRAKGLGIRRLEFVDRQYNYIGWNQANPLFKSKKVRQALTMAIDRERIIRQNLNGMGIQITGTFFYFSPSYNHAIQPYPFDPQQARLLLAEEGWFDSNGDGILDKIIDGKSTPFQFTLTYYVKNQTTKAICEYISTALKEIGILCNLNGVDLADLSATFDDKSFDAIFLGWALGSPPEDPKQLWSSAGAKEKGSSNAIGFANAEIDDIIHQLDYEYDYDKRLKLYHRFSEILYDEAPYTFLYTPKALIAYREYLQNVFIPADRQDLIPGANVGEPQPSIFWIKREKH